MRKTAAGFVPTDLAKIAEEGVTAIGQAAGVAKPQSAPKRKLQRTSTFRKQNGGIALKGTVGEYVEPATTEVRPWKTSQEDHESQTLAALMVGEPIKAYNHTDRLFEPAILKIDRRVNFMYVMTENANVNCANKDLKDLNVLARDPIKLNTLQRSFIGDEALERCAVRGIRDPSLTADTAVVITYGSEKAREQLALTMIMSSLYDLPKGISHLHKYVPSREDQETLAAGTLQRHVRARPLRQALLKGKRILNAEYDWEDVLRTADGDPIKLALRWNDGRSAGLQLDPVPPYEEYTLPGDQPEGLSTFWLTKEALEAFALQRLIPAVTAARASVEDDPTLAKHLADRDLSNLNPALRDVLKQGALLEVEAMQLAAKVEEGSLGNQLRQSFAGVGEDLGKLQEQLSKSFADLSKVGVEFAEGVDLAEGVDNLMDAQERMLAGLPPLDIPGRASILGNAPQAISTDDVVLSTDPIQGKTDRKPDEDYGFCARGRSQPCRQQ